MGPVTPMSGSDSPDGTAIDTLIVAPTTKHSATSIEYSTDVAGASNGRELETRVPASELIKPAPGYIGMQGARSQNVSGPMWEHISKLSGPPELVIISPDSPARARGFKYFELIETIDGKSPSVFFKNLPPAATTVKVCWYPEGSSQSISTDVTLIEPPDCAKPPRKPRRSRTRVLEVASGPPVLRGNRPEWLSYLNASSDLSPAARLIGTHMANKWARNNGTTFELSLKTIADVLGLCRRTVISSIDELTRAGWLVRNSGKARRRKNVYTTTWPLNLSPREDRSTRRSPASS
jgi:hypothetical protein